MADTYVVNGAKLKCPLGSAPSTLMVTPGRNVMLRGKPKANIGDCKPMVNIMPFGTCAKMSPPVPCTPTCAMWVGGKMDTLVQGQPALLSSSFAVCAAGGGMIKIEKDGQ